MKNIMKVALLSLLCLGAVSCNLNKYPSNAILAKDGFQKFEDAGEFRNGFYSFTRTCFSSSIVIPVNIQGEGINATKDYGNIQGPQYLWNFLDNNDVVSTIWSNCYIAIFHLNYFLEKSNELLENDAQLPKYDDNKMDTTELKNMQLYMAEARFFRAMLNHQLATFYCKAYDPATASTDLGIILSDKADVNARLSRSSMELTYKFINDDIEAAQPVIDKYYAEINSPVEYVSPYAVKCLQAKVYLDMHRFEESAALCEEIVRNYPLINTQSAFNALWANDTGTEIIFQFFASPNEGRSNLGGMFLNDPYRTGEPLYPQYIPTKWIYDQYDQRDIRKAAYFRSANIKIGVTTYTVYVLWKYPGNPALNSQAGINDLMNHVRPYRSADFQLMAAECYARLNDLNNANASLQQLLEARMTGVGDGKYKYQPYGSIEEVMVAIQNERLKEMFMEGNRIADLKRWGKPMSRLGMDPQNANAALTTGLYLEIPADDYRFVWPIPQAETNFNYSLNGQQNEGWRNN